MRERPAATRSRGGFDILDLDTRDLDVPFVGGVVHDLQQAMIDFVSLRQELSKSIERITVRIMIRLRMAVDR